MTEQQVREHVRKLSRFYTDALIYAIVNLGLILIWAISGGGYFWPIWVIIGWGIGLGVHAFSLGLIPQMNAMVPFMTAEWEDQEVRRILNTGPRAKEKTSKTHAPTQRLAEKISKEISHIEEEVKAAVKKAKVVKKPKKKKTTKAKKALAVIKAPKAVKAKKTKKAKKAKTPKALKASNVSKAPKAPKALKARKVANMTTV